MKRSVELAVPDVTATHHEPPVFPWPTRRDRPVPLGLLLVQAKFHNGAGSDGRTASWDGRQRPPVVAAPFEEALGVAGGGFAEWRRV